MVGNLTAFRDPLTPSVSTVCKNRLRVRVRVQRHRPSGTLFIDSSPLPPDATVVRENQHTSSEDARRHPSSLLDHPPLRASRGPARLRGTCSPPLIEKAPAALHKKKTTKMKEMIDDSAAPHPLFCFCFVFFASFVRPARGRRIDGYAKTRAERQTSR